MKKNMADTNKYTVLLQNNASKEFYNYSGLTNESPSHLFYKFNVELDIPDGEYTIAVFINNRDDVNYEFKTPLLETILKVEGYDDIPLRDIQPSLGLLRIGEKAPAENIYEGGNDDNKIFYYDN